jgi:hypothetical protein
MHPILITALAGDRRRRRPCGAVAQQRYGLCCECQVVTVWRPEAARTRHRAISSWTRAKAAQVRFFARVASVIRLSSQKAES